MVNDLIPREVVLSTFGVILAISPRIYKQIVDSMAKQYCVDSDELSSYISKVLQEESDRNPKPPGYYDDW